MSVRPDPSATGGTVSSSRFTALLGVTAVTFFLCLLPFEMVPEIPVDIDAKPFFVPLAIAALLPGARTGLAIGLGVALGEGLRDLMEGYEIDDPIGFVGYVVAFWLASLLFALAPRSRAVLIVGALFCALVQSVLEATSFLLFGGEALGVAVYSALGNTLSHGLIWGAIPLLLLVPALRGRFEHHLGFAPAGTRPTRPLAATSGAPIPTDAVAGLEGVAYRPPGMPEALLHDVSLAIRPGEVIALSGRAATSPRALTLLLTGIAPAATGGERVGTARPPATVAIVSGEPHEQVTQARAAEEVAASLMGSAGHDAAQARREASRLLRETGLPDERHEAFAWALSAAELARVHLAAAMASEPALLVLDRADGLLDERLLENAIATQRRRGAVLVVPDDVTRLAHLTDRLWWVEDGTVSDASYALEEPTRLAAIRRARTETAAAPAAPYDADAAADASPAANATANAPSADAPGERPAGGTASTWDAGALRVPTLQTGRSGWWSRRDPRVKWAMLVATILLIYLAPDWRLMTGMVGIAALVTATTRPPWVWLALALLVQIPNLLGLLLIPLLGEGAAPQELAFGARLALGWLAALLMAISLMSSMEIPEMVSGLHGLGLPRRFAFVVGYAWVLVYLSLADINVLLRQVRERGGFAGARGVAGLLRDAWRLFVPVIVTVARRGGAMAVALEAKGRGQKAIPVATKRFDLADAALATITAATLAIVAAARFVG